MKQSMRTGSLTARTVGQPCRAWLWVQRAGGGIAGAVSSSATENFPMERGPERTQMRERLQATVWASTDLDARKRQAGCSLRLLPTEILRSLAGPGLETGGLALMTLLQMPLAAGFPFWPVIPGHLSPSSQRWAACSGS